MSSSGSPGPAPTNVREPRLGCGGAACNLTAARGGCGAMRAGVQDVVTVTNASNRSIAAMKLLQLLVLPLRVPGLSRRSFS